jgi:Tol biopolymer transport system component
MTYLDSDQKLWRSRIDGTEALQLTKEMVYAQLSSWSPDGRKIAFMGANPGKPWRIFIVDRNGGEPKEASRGEDAQGAPTWSPDGSKIAYGNVLCSESQSCWIRVIDLATGHEEKLPGSHDLRTARWSPDGKYIAALSPDTHQLMLFDVAKSHWRVLAENVTGDTINWAQDSKEVYADSPQGERPVIESFRISNGERKLVVGLSELEKVPGRMEFWFGLTPDGSSILVHLFTASEIYSIEWGGT